MCLASAGPLLAEVGEHPGATVSIPGEMPNSSLVLPIDFCTTLGGFLAMIFGVQGGLEGR